jgi:SP family sugar:H+ symporter-like MFS transporter
LGWLQLFRGQDRRRTLVGMGMLCLQQGQRISFTNNYLNITMLNLGFTNTYQLLVALYAGKWFITLFGFYLPDRIGRRPMVIVGAVCMGACMYTMAAVAAATNNEPTGSLGSLTLASIFIWVVRESTTC